MRKIILTIFLFIVTAGSAGGYFYLDHQINIGAKKIADGTQRIKDGQKQIRAGQARLNAGQRKLAEGKEQLAKGKQTYKTMKAIPYNQLSIDMPKAAPLFKALEYKVAQGGQKIKEGKQQIAHGAKQIAAGKKKLADGRQRLAAGESALIKGEKQLAFAKKIRDYLGFGAIGFGILTLISLGFCFRRKKS